MYIYQDTPSSSVIVALQSLNERFHLSPRQVVSPCSLPKTDDVVMERIPLPQFPSKFIYYLFELFFHIYFDYRFIYYLKIHP